MFDRASAQILFAILLTAVQSCFGVSFRTVKTITVNSGPQAVIFADLTGDTKQDIVVANGLGSSISVILNNGAGWFLPSHTYSVGWGPYAIATGDFNEDGRLDLAVTTTKGLSVLLGNGDGTFQAAVTYSAVPPIIGISKSVNGIGVGHFTGTAHLDVVVTSADNSQVNVLKGDGAGHFAFYSSYRQFTSPLRIAVGDFNGDGLPDFAVSDGLSPDVTVYMNVSSQTFHTTAYRIGTGPALIVSRDMNGDGNLDLIVGDQAGADVLLGNGDGTFKAPVTYVSSLSTGACVGDVNGDGKPDLILPNSNGMAVLLGNGDGSFRSPQTFASGSEPGACAAADFNGDRITDIAVANYAGRNVSIFAGLGGGKFLAAQPSNVDSKPGSLLLADLNHDGKMDGVVGLNDGTVGVLLRGASGGFGPATHIQTGLSAAPYASSVKIAVADFNKDGNPDIVAGHEGTQDLSLMLGNGDGTFQPARIFQISPNFTSDIVTGDFNHDGIADLAIAAYDSVWIALGNGDGSFQPSVSYWSGGGIRSGLVTDFNTDGKKDLAFADLADQAISIFLGNGDGTFQPALRVSFSGQPISIAAADLNGDKKPDIVVAFNNRNYISLLVGNGDASFQSPLNVATDTNENFVALGDINGDHKLDVVAANNREVSVFTGKGDGTFSSVKSFAGGSDPVAIAVGNLNGDSAIDILIAPSQATSVIPLLNAGGSRVIFSLSPNPAAYGQTVTMSATVSPTLAHSPVPTGIVTFKSGSSTLGSAALSQGKATVQISNLSKGSHIITAYYSGNANYNPNSSTLTEHIQ